MRRYDIDSIDNRDPELVARSLAAFERVAGSYFRAEVRGIERIPEGAALYVGNHNAGILSPDTGLFAAAVHRTLGLAAVPYGLAHEVALELPLLHQLLVPMGAVRASHDSARRLFARGDKVLVYPGGDQEALRPFRHRNRIVFGGRDGYIRSALRAGVPVIPFVAAGAHATFVILDDGRWLARVLGADRWLRLKVWPITLCLPWGLVVGPVPYVPWPTRILIEVMQPMSFDRVGEVAAKDDAYVRACADRVEAAMQATLDRLADERERGESATEAMIEGGA